MNDSFPRHACISDMFAQMKIERVQIDINHFLPFYHLLCDLMFSMFYFRINSLPLSDFLPYGFD